MMPTCHCLTFMCCQACLPNFQCFQSCVSWTPLLHFLFFLCKSCHSLRNVSLVGHILGLIKSVYHAWLNMMTSSEGPFLFLPRSPPTLNPPLGISAYRKAFLLFWRWVFKEKTEEIWSWLLLLPDFLAYRIV